MSLLIITAAIEIKTDDIYILKIKDTNVRLNQYLDSLNYAINEYKTVETIIFCDNSNYLHDYRMLIEKAKLKGKNLEVLSFSGDIKSVINQGKGYGEGEILSYIFKNSKYIHNFESFYKLTGRLTVKNFDKINSYKNNENTFIYYSKDMYGIEDSLVSTVFYKANKNTYMDYFINAYKDVKDSEMKFLEVVFCQIIKNYAITCRSFNTFPVISGYSGSTGLKYDQSNKKILLENILNLLGLHNTKTNFFKQLLYKTIFFIKKGKK